MLEHDFGVVWRFGSIGSIGNIGDGWVFKQTLASALILHPQYVWSWILEVLEMLEIDEERD